MMWNATKWCQMQKNAIKCYTSHNQARDPESVQARKPASLQPSQPICKQASGPASKLAFSMKVQYNIV